MYRKTFATAVAVMLAGVSGGTAHAQQLTRVVSYHDLDLATPAGARQFKHRLQRAIDGVCRRPDPTRPLTGTEDQDCRTEVAARIEPQMLNAVLLAEQRAATELAAR